MFFAPDGIKDAGGDHAEAHGQDHKTAVLYDFSAVQAGKEENADVLAENQQYGNEQAGDQDGNFQGTFDIQPHFRMFAAVEIFGEFRNQYECK